MACNMPAGGQRRFAFEKYLPFRKADWDAIKQEAADEVVMPDTGQKPIIFGSDVAHRMVDFAQRNAERAGVAGVIEFRGGDALQRMPPMDVSATGGGVMILNPPYGERIDVGGVARPGRIERGQKRYFSTSSPGSERAGSYEDDSDARVEVPEQQGRFGARELPQTDNGGDFFSQLATHWKKNYAGWTAWMLTPDLKLPGKMRLKESRRVPMWNGPIECRMFRFDMVVGSAREGKMGSDQRGKMGSDHRAPSDRVL
jgi:putative N6-adenine-specific DNA methylase